MLQAQFHAWLASRLSLEELHHLLGLIRHHDHRLQALGGVVVPAAVRDAVLADATLDPVLATALLRVGVRDHE